MKKITSSIKIICIMLHIFYNASAQWTTVGAPNFANGGGDYVFSAVAPNGEPYVVYREYSHYAKAAVKKFDGSNWVTVGNAGFSLDAVFCTTMAIDGNNIPYVAYSDSTRKASVMKFDGSSWVYVGNCGFTSGAGSYTSIAIDGNGIPYVAFRDFFHNYRASVMKFDGNNWVYVGSPGFSAFGSGQAGAVYTSLAIDKNGTPYVAYTELSNNLNVTVMKFDGSNWVYVGGAAEFSTGGANNPSIVIDSNGVPYVGYEDNGNGSKATVKKFDGSNWVPVGVSGFSPGVAEYTSLAIDNNNKLYLAFEDYANNKRASVMSFDGNNWSTVGTAGFSDSVAQYTTIAIDKNKGILYVAYEDLYDGTTNYPKYNATVMKFETTTAGINETKNNSSLTVYPNPSDGVFQVNYFSSEKSKLQLNIVDAKGKIVFAETISQSQGEFKKDIDLGRKAKGIYFIELLQGNSRLEQKFVLQ